MSFLNHHTTLPPCCSIEWPSRIYSSYLCDSAHSVCLLDFFALCVLYLYIRAMRTWKHEHMYIYIYIYRSIISETTIFYTSISFSFFLHYDGEQLETTLVLLTRHQLLLLKIGPIWQSSLLFSWLRFGFHSVSS
jgi:hypothetical protein